MRRNLRVGFVDIPPHMSKMVAMKTILVLHLLAGFLVCNLNASEIEERIIEYKDGDVVLEGFLALPADTSTPAPGVLIIHDWTGVGDYVKSRARQLASLGYVAFAADIYGKGIRPTDPKDCAAEATKYKSNLPLFHSRLNAGLQTLEGQQGIDKSRIAAIGYCFGGSGVLELARSGADIAGVVSFHGSLGTSAPASKDRLKTKILVLHGADDPYVPAQEVTEFQKEMSLAAADWQFISYGNAVHSFSKEGAGTDTASGNAHDPKADARSWEHMKAFFNEIFQ